MERTCHWLFITAIIVLSGCGNGPSTPAQEFNNIHGGKTVTPNGRIVEGSAQDAGEAKVSYKTEDGKKWVVERTGEKTFESPRPAN